MTVAHTSLPPASGTPTSNSSTNFPLELSTHRANASKVAVLCPDAPPPLPSPDAPARPLPVLLLALLLPCCWSNEGDTAPARDDRRRWAENMAAPALVGVGGRDDRRGRIHTGVESSPSSLGLAPGTCWLNRRRPALGVRVRLADDTRRLRPVVLSRLRSRWWLPGGGACAVPHANTTCRAAPSPVPEDAESASRTHSETEKPGGGTGTAWPAVDAASCCGTAAVAAAAAGRRTHTGPSRPTSPHGGATVPWPDGECDRPCACACAFACACSIVASKGSPPMPHNMAGSRPSPTTARRASGVDAMSGAAAPAQLVPSPSPMPVTADDQSAHPTSRCSSCR